MILYFFTKFVNQYRDLPIWRHFNFWKKKTSTIRGLTSVKQPLTNYWLLFIKWKGFATRNNSCWWINNLIIELFKQKISCLFTIIKMKPLNNWLYRRATTINLNTWKCQNWIFRKILRWVLARIFHIKKISIRKQYIGLNLGLNYIYNWKWI